MKFSGSLKRCYHLVRWFGFYDLLNNGPCVLISDTSPRHPTSRWRLHGQPPSARRPQSRRRGRVHHRKGQQPRQQTSGRKRPRQTRRHRCRRASPSRRSFARLLARTPSHQNPVHVEKVKKDWTELGKDENKPVKYVCRSTEPVTRIDKNFQTQFSRNFERINLARPWLLRPQCWDLPRPSPSWPRPDPGFELQRRVWGQSGHWVSHDWVVWRQVLSDLCLHQLVLISYKIEKWRKETEKGTFYKGGTNFKQMSKTGYSRPHFWFFQSFQSMIQ